MDKNYKHKLKENKGITGLDIVISMIVIATLTGLIATLMAKIYYRSIEIQKSANANAYATIVLEKVDENPYESVDNNFLTTISQEVVIDSDYTVTIAVENIEGVDENIMKKVTVNVKYSLQGEEKQLIISKLKIKEIYNGE